MNDVESAGFPSQAGSPLSRTRLPLVAAAISFATGMAATSFAGPIPVLAAAAAAALLSAAARFNARLIQVSAVFLAVGAMLFTSEEFSREVRGIEIPPGRSQSLVRVEACAEESPSVFEAPLQGGRPRGRILVRIESVMRGSERRPAGGLAMLHHCGIPEGLMKGDRIEVTGVPFRPEPSGVPGAGGYARFMEQKGAAIGISAPEAHAVRKTADAGYGPLALVERLRNRLLRSIKETFEPETAGLMASLLLGDRKGLDFEVRDSFVRSGTIHMLAISGLHLMVVSGGVYFLLTAAGMGLRTRAAAMIAFVAFFACITGLNAPVVRSAIMSAAYLSADLAGRRRCWAAALAIAAIAILAARPSQVLNPGFQLSFASVMSIGTFSSRISGFFLARTRLAVRLSGGRRTAGDRAREYLWTAVSVSAAAYVGTVPITLCHFNILTPSVIAANLAAAPLLSLALYAGFFSLPLTALGGFAGQACAAVLEPLSGALVFVVDLFSRAPFSYVYLPSPGLFRTAAFYAGLAAAAAFRGGKARAAGAAVAAAAFASFLAPLWLSSSPGSFEASVLDVGHGLCFVLRSPGGEVLVYDAGSKGFEGAGSLVVAPFLWDSGITRIDVLILSHPDSDHINGAADLAERFGVGRVVVSEGFERKPEGAKLLCVFESLGIRVDIVSEGGLVPEMTPAYAEIIHPQEGAGYAGSNDGSLVLSVSVPGGRRMLVLGDLEGAGLADLFGRYPGLKADLVVVPHHGAPAPVWNSILASNACAAVISADSSERAWETMMLYERKGCRAWWTHASGTVTAVFDPDGSLSVSACCARGFPAGMPRR